MGVKVEETHAEKRLRVDTTLHWVATENTELMELSAADYLKSMVLEAFDYLGTLPIFSHLDSEHLLFMASNASVKKLEYANQVRPAILHACRDYMVGLMGDLWWMHSP
jgi:hypothetical protein